MLIHMKSIWKAYIHNFTWNLFELQEFIVNFIWTSYEVHMNFSWTSYEMKSNLFIWNSWEVHMNFIWSSNELLMNFIWNEMKFIKMNLQQFVWSSYELYIEELMKLIFYIHVIQMKLTWGSYTVCMKYIWKAYEFRKIWTSRQLPKNCMTSTQEVPMYYTWIWSRATLLCTSYEWTSRSIVCIGFILLLWGLYIRRHQM